MTPLPARLRAMAVVLVLALSGVTAGVAAPNAGADTPWQCFHADTAPEPPSLGVVLWAPAGAGVSNTLVLPHGTVYRAESSCALPAQKPTTILVAARSSLGIWGNDETPTEHRVLFPWGGASVRGSSDLIGTPSSASIPASDWSGVDALEVIPAFYTAETFGTCRGCDLSNYPHPLPGPAPANLVYGQGRFPGDFSDANLRGSTLSGRADGYTFDGSDLTGASLQGSFQGAGFADVVLDGTTFSGAALSGAMFQGSRFAAQSPPRLVGGTSIGAFNGACTSFTNGNWLGVSFADLVFAPGSPGCSSRSSMANSTIPFGLWRLYVAAGQSVIVDRQGTTIVASASDRGSLKGADLTGRDHRGLAVTGLPLDLRGTTFDGADLTGVQLPLAQLAGASLRGVTATDASFQGASFAASGGLPAATFAGASTSLRSADLVGSDVSGVSFQGADISGADFYHARAVGSDFNSVLATGTSFAGAHLYGAGNAFESARDLTDADFTGAVLAGDGSTGGGFNFTGALLSGAHFDGSVCVACNFTNATLKDAQLTGAYLPGVNLSGALMVGAKLDQAWLFCGSVTNAQCAQVPGSTPLWAWPLTLGTGETYGPVPFGRPPITGIMLAGVTTCPDGTPGQNGCSTLLPDTSVTWAPPACSASAHGSCPTPTKTWVPTPAAKVDAAPLSTADSSPLNLVPSVPRQGYYTGYDDATVRLVGNGTATVVAGTPGSPCAGPTGCGDGGPATSARLGRPSGVAVGRDGTLYIADNVLRRLRAVSTSGTITTIAGTGDACPGGKCGDGGSATRAALAAANGVVVDAAGTVYIADGPAGIRRVDRDGVITTLAAGSVTANVVALASGLDGTLYASTRGPDAVVAINPLSGAVTPLVGTGASGYNGNSGTFGPQSGTSTQVNQPTGLSATQDGSLVFADTGNHLVRRYNLASGNMASNVAGVVDASGKPVAGDNGDGASSDRTLLHSPMAVAATGTALDLVADTGNRRYRLVGPPIPSGGGPAQPPPGSRTFILDCSPGVPWTCRRLPGPTADQDVRTQKNVSVVVTRGGAQVASGPLLLLGGGKRYLVTETSPLEGGAYRLVVSAGTGSRTVSVEITSG